MAEQQRLTGEQQEAKKNKGPKRRNGLDNQRETREQKDTNKK